MYLPKINRAITSVLSGNILLFVCGTALTWSSSEIPKLLDPSTTPFTRKITPEEASWISSLLTLGASLGPFLSAYFSDKIGRKHTLLYLVAPFLVCHPFLAFSTTPEVFYMARFLIGLALGGAFTILPIYIGEISDKSNRGALSSSMSCFVCFGILFSCALGPYVSVMLFNLTLTMFPLVFLISFYHLSVETPHFYLNNNDVEKAKTILKELRPNQDAVDKELAEIQACSADVGLDNNLVESFSYKPTIRALVISVGLLVFQQFSGINAVLFYSQQIFEQTGTSFPPEICTIIVVGVQFFSSFLTPLIVDKFGRKIILFWSAMGMAASEVPLGVYCYLRNYDIDVGSVAFLPILSLTSFIFCFNSGFGPLPWALMCELFPSSVKSIASASVASLIWILAFFVTKYFEVMIAVVGMGQLFLFFAFCCTVAGLFVVFCVVETKGKSLKEIQDILSV